MIKSFPSKINLIIAAFTISCFFLLSCENDDKDIAAWTGNKPMVDEAKNVESYLSQDGKVKARLVAPLMFRTMGIDSPRIDFPNTLHCDFYNDSSKVETRLDSKHGKYFETFSKVYLWDSVVVISINGDTLLTHNLWWDQNIKQFYTDSTAIYKGPNKLWNGGKGMVASQDLSSIKFKELTGTVKVKDDGLPQ